MAVLLTEKRKVLNIFYTVIALLFFVLIPNMRCGGNVAYTLLDGWIPPITCIYFVSLTLSCLAAWLGMNVLSLVFALPHLIFLGCAAVMIFMYDQSSWGMLVIFALALLQIAILLLFFKKGNGDFCVKFVLSKKEILLNSLLTILLLLSYYYAKCANCVVFIDGRDYLAYNLFGTFLHETRHGNLFELIMSFGMFFAVLFAWLKRYKVSFGTMMAFALGTVIAFFFTINTWARTDIFNNWAIVSVLAILCSILIFKTHLPKNQRKDEELAKLEMLKEAGVITEEVYQKKIAKIASKETDNQ